MCVSAQVLQVVRDSVVQKIKGNKRREKKIKRKNKNTIKKHAAFHKS